MNCIIISVAVIQLTGSYFFLSRVHIHFKYQSIHSYIRWMSESLLQHITLHTNTFSVILLHLSQCDVERMGMSIGGDNDGEPSGCSKRENLKI